MTAALLTTLATTLLCALVAAGVFAAMAGAVVAVVATDADRPVQLSLRTAGIAALCIGLAVFWHAVAAITALLA